MDIIKTDKLVKKFKKLVAVDELSLNIKKGEVFGLLGPNGAGKTTTINMLCTLMKPTSGTASVNRFNILSEASKVRESIGLVFQETILDEDLTAFHNLDFHARLYRVPKDVARKRINHLLKLVELYDRKDTKVKEYSGGMKRRLEIARGLVHHPKVLFLDEPTLGLDPKTRKYIWEYIKKLNKKKKTTVILTTHYMDEADHLCDRVAIINKGKIVITDTPEALKNTLGGDIIKVELEKAPKTIVAKLNKLNFINSAKLENSLLYLTVEKAETKIEKTINTLKRLKLKIKSITMQKPTLDDVFLHYTGEHLQNA